jgi:hypothetical protein
MPSAGSARDPRSSVLRCSHATASLARRSPQAKLLPVSHPRFVFYQDGYGIRNVSQAIRWPAAGPNPGDKMQAAKKTKSKTKSTAKPKDLKPRRNPKAGGVSGGITKLGSKRL